MKKIFNSLAIAALILLSCTMQSQQIISSQCYGTAENEFVHDVKRTSDGGYIAAGYTETPEGMESTTNHGQKDFWIIKIQQNGTVAWQKNLGGSLNDEAWSVVETPQGQYIIAGCSFSNDVDITDHIGDTEHCDIWLVWLNHYGDLIQSKSYGTMGDEFAVGIAMSSQNKIYVAAQVSAVGENVDMILGGTDFWLSELDINGNMVWQNVYGGIHNDHPSQILFMQNDGIYIAGTSYSFGSSTNDGEAYIVKVDENGDILWDKSLTTSSEIGTGTVGKLSFTPQGGILVSYIGSTQNDDHNCNAHGSFLFCSLDSEGEVTGEYCYGGNGQDYAGGGISDDDDEDDFWIFGNTNSEDGDVPPAAGYSENESNVWMGHHHGSENLEWTASLGGSGSDLPVQLINIGSEKMALFANSNSNNGNVVGQHDISGSSFDMWLVVIDALASSNESPIEKPTLGIYPNPVTDQLTIQLDNSIAVYRLQITDATGKTVDIISNLAGRINYSTNSLPAGAYSIQAFNQKGERLASSRFMKM